MIVCLFFGSVSTPALVAGVFDELIGTTEVDGRLLGQRARATDDDLERATDGALVPLWLGDAGRAAATEARRRGLIPITHAVPVTWMLTRRAADPAAYLCARAFLADQPTPDELDVLAELWGAGIDVELRP